MKSKGATLENKIDFFSSVTTTQIKRNVHDFETYLLELRLN